jgi:glutamate racemase
MSTIGVFDSGFGGLTVLRALLNEISDASYLYLGDTARLPYGSKSRETIARYAVTSARFLERQGAEFLVIACNTASALALDVLQAEMPIPVIGVIEPGAAAAKSASPFGDVLVLATEATVQSHAYAAACDTLGLRTLEKACPLLVPLVEEGWIEHPVTDEVLRIYLSQALAQARENNLAPETLLLGCTHYPLLRGPIERILAELGSSMRVIDSAEATAKRVAEMLLGEKLKDPARYLIQQSTFYATDSIEKFRRLGSHFLGRTLERVEHIDLGG